MRAMRLAVETTLKQVTGRRFRFGAPVGGNEIGILPGFFKELPRLPRIVQCLIIGRLAEPF